MSNFTEVVQSSRDNRAFEVNKIKKGRERLRDRKEKNKWVFSYWELSEMRSRLEKLGGWVYFSKYTVRGLLLRSKSNDYSSSVLKPLIVIVELAQVQWWPHLLPHYFKVLHFHILLIFCIKIFRAISKHEIMITLGQNGASCNLLIFYLNFGKWSWWNVKWQIELYVFNLIASLSFCI